MDESRHRVKGVLLDLDGVFYVGDQLIPGAVEALASLRQRHIACRFITNTTTQSAVQLHGKLQQLGLVCSPGELITAPVATASYLRARGISRCYFAVNPAVMPDFEGFVSTDQQPEAVVIGDIGEAWSYSLLDSLFHFLMDGASLVAMHRNRYWQVSGGLHVDIGAFVAGLEYVASVNAIITGKPSAEFFDAALSSLGVGRSEVIVVGDDIQSDIGGARHAGLRGALVQTGKYRQALVAASDIVPEWTIPSIADIGVCL